MHGEFDIVQGSDASANHCSLERFEVRCGLFGGQYLIYAASAFPSWIVLLVLAIAIAVWIFSSIQAKKRTQAMQEVAQQIGFNFVGNDQSSATQVRTALFNKGSSRKFRNIMNGAFAGFQANLFDYSYTTSNGRNSSTWIQTVAAFMQDSHLPLFELRPEGFLDRVSEVFVHQDIDFESHPEFSRRYMLSGPEEQAVRELFTPALLTFFEALPPEKKWHIEGGEGTLFVYRSAATVKPDDIRSFLEETSSIAQTFFASGGLKHWK
jgi:hypothetical protein